MVHTEVGAPSCHGGPPYLHKLFVIPLDGEAVIYLIILGVIIQYALFCCSVLQLWPWELCSVTQPCVTPHPFQHFLPSMDISVSKLWEMVKGREAWRACCSPPGHRVGHDLAPEQQYVHSQPQP